MLLGLGLAALTLAACGSDKSSDRSTGSTTGNESQATGGTTGTTGASGASGATGASPLASTPGAGKKGSSGGSAAPSGGDTAKSTPSTPTGTQNSTPHSPPKKKKPVFAPGSFAGQSKQLYKQSKEVCSYLTLDGLAREYNVKPKTPEAVARRYSKAYPKNARDAVYRGCKAGLSS